MGEAGLPPESLRSSLRHMRCADKAVQQCVRLRHGRLYRSPPLQVLQHAPDQPVAIWSASLFDFDRLSIRRMAYISAYPAIDLQLVRFGPKLEINAKVETNITAIRSVHSVPAQLSDMSSLTQWQTRL
jgi:hypothetical protein